MPSHSIPFLVLSTPPSSASAPSISLAPLPSLHPLQQLKLPPSFVPYLPSSSNATPTNSRIKTGNGVTVCPGSGGATVMMLGGKEGKGPVVVWDVKGSAGNGQGPIPPLTILHPPAPLCIVSLSPVGTHLAAGTADGRILLWEVTTGTLLIALDAHYRAISALVWTHDGTAIISGSDDSSVSVWSLGRLLSSGGQAQQAPFASLNGHTLPITGITAGAGVFPKLRILTASKDCTVKLWKLSSTSLLSTFSFPSSCPSISHVIFDPIERFFYAIGEHKDRIGGWCRRVDLYAKSMQGTRVASMVGGGGLTDEVRLDDGEVGTDFWSTNSSITSAHLSSLSPHLFLTTTSSSTPSKSHLQVLSSPSLLPVRAPHLFQDDLAVVSSVMLAPISAERKSKREVGSMGRVVGDGGGAVGVGRWTSIAISQAEDVSDSIQLPFFDPPDFNALHVEPAGDDSPEREKEKEIARLKEENVRLREMAARAVGFSERLWRGVVEDAVPE